MDGNFSQQPQYNDFQNYPSGQGTNTTAIAALVCGIIGLIGIFIPIFVYRGYTFYHSNRLRSQRHEGSG